MPQVDGLQKMNHTRSRCGTKEKYATGWYEQKTNPLPVLSGAGYFFESGAVALLVEPILSAEKKITFRHDLRLLAPENMKKFWMMFSVANISDSNRTISDSACRGCT